MKKVEKTLESISEDEENNEESDEDDKKETSKSDGTVCKMFEHNIMKYKTLR